MIIDLEHHFSISGNHRAGVERYWENGGLRFFPSSVGSDIENHIWFMDGAGIDMAVLTGQLFSPTLDRMKTWNDGCAEAVAKHPTRFVGFSGAMPLGGDAAFDEMERAVKQLGMKGVQISARPGGLHLDDRQLWPFYEKVAELGVPIDVHIASSPTGYDALESSYGLYYVLGREYDICTQVFRVCFGGVLEDFPDLKLLINHFGGGAVAIKDRMDLYEGLCGDEFYEDKPLISKPYNHYFDKLYFNMAGRGRGIGTVKSALNFISPKKMMFGTDWPLNYENDPDLCKGYIDDINGLDLAQEDIDDMLGGNAARLLGL
ncbi:MAG: amidohydrolase family protein [Rhodospirillales bacterium]|nr:amidohydrolase family protein [Rhodospirillales bacterium]